MRYPYRCNECGIEFDVERSIHAEASAPFCPECKVEMWRVYITPPIQFKGSGFYSTDNK